MSFRHSIVPGILTLLFAAVSSLAVAETVTYTYDAMQRLVRAQYASGPVIEYVYDNMGNRLARTLAVTSPPANGAPNQAASPSPASGATGVTAPLSLAWSGSDPNQGDRLSYFVYAGTSAGGLQLVWSGAAASFTPWSLAANTTYYWRVVTRDNHNAETTGPIWSFTTGNAIVNGLPVHLSVSLSGTGGGTVTSIPPGIVCTGAATDVCDGDFQLGAPVTLAAVTDNASKFGGWSIASCATNPNCAFTMTNDSIVSAAFDGVPPIRIVMTMTIPSDPPTEFSFNVEMENFASTAQMIQVMTSYPMTMLTTGRVFTENFDFNSGTQTVAWKGGYAGDFSAVTGYTQLQGVLTITGGALSVERLVIR